MKKESKFLLNTLAKGFEEIKQIDENGIEFWSARNLFPLLGYSTWQKFGDVILRAQKACYKSEQVVEDHFNRLVKMVNLGSGSERKIADFKLDRYACYLIAQNGDSKIQEIALAQTYFAIQTRKQEIYRQEELEKSQKRLFVRKEVTTQNKKLFSTAKQSGVNNFGSFNDAGYWGLYGMPLSEIEKRKNIKKGELLDRADSVELAANLFRITQTEERLKRENVNTQYHANTVHNSVGGTVRDAIKRNQGGLPENRKPVEHIKDVRKNVKLLKKKRGK